MTVWRPDRQWSGLVAVIVGGGESFTAAQARLIGMARAKDLVRVIAINDAIYPCWFADIAFGCDARWWKHHGPLPGFLGRRVSIDDSGFPEVDLITCTGKTGFDPEPGCIRSGGNGGYQMLHAAAHLAVRMAILVAIDMHGSHWFGDHPSQVWKTPQNFENRIRDFSELAAALRERCIDVVNVSPTSRLPHFRRADLAGELEKLEAEHAA